MTAPAPAGPAQAPEARRARAPGPLIALSFLTVLPVPFLRIQREDEMDRAPLWFPVIGLLLGALVWGAAWLLGRALPHQLVVVLALALGIALTGALHFDGFLDSVDGLFAPHVPVERRFEIMHDHHVGSYALAAGFCLLATELLALLSLPIARFGPALLLTPMVARWTMLLAIRVFPYGLEGGMGLWSKRGTHTWTVLAGGVFTLAVALAVAQWRGAVLVAALAVVALLSGTFVTRRMGGMSGDTYGATEVLCEVVALVLLVGLR